jgi:hypothetical protein
MLQPDDWRVHDCWKRRVQGDVFQREYLRDDVLPYGCVLQPAHWRMRHYR